MDLPTPPLPEPIARIRATPGTFIGPGCGLGWPPILSDGAAGLPCGAASCAVSATCTSRTPSSARTACSAARRSGSICRAIAGEAASITNRMSAPSIVSARTMSRLTRSPPSGRLNRCNASSTVAFSTPISLSSFCDCTMRRGLTNQTNIGDFPINHTGLPKYSASPS